MYLILNRILLLFGVRIVNDKKVVFLYHTYDYSGPERKQSGHVIKLSDNSKDVFGFLNMDYSDYKKQQFKTIFEFTEWVTENCKYLTVNIVKDIAKEVEKIPEKERHELLTLANKFVNTIKIGHIILRDFQYTPIIMYPNLRESIVRNYFDSDEVTNQFVNIKLERLHKTELPGKFSPRNVVHWIRPLRSNPKLTGIFTRSFVDYITQNNFREFPRFLVDIDKEVLKKEVISYYYNMFPNSAAFREYALESTEMNEVKQEEAELELFSAL